ncbi:hypothetical protein M0811_11930 [Anaeramoeba ignava]|uniref:BTB domain-containing protein n=1 Tax=Anaeramoeba ignava TaxID=1746090 RepID=A0A9Q0LBR8_ANAIG|nr:hypothetical protein M0811_11930 [Anaeramoeba ignava]
MNTYFHKSSQNISPFYLKNESKPKTKTNYKNLKNFNKNIRNKFYQYLIKTSDIQIYCGIDKRILYCHKSILTARSLTF